MEVGKEERGKGGRDRDRGEGGENPMLGGVRERESVWVGGGGWGEEGNRNCISQR